MASPKTIARLEAQIKRRAAHCLQFEISDPRASIITITRVELSSDVATGKIFYSVLGEDADRSKAAHMVKHAAGFIQRQVASVLRLRRMPHLRWQFDESYEESIRLSELIAQARIRDKEINPDLEIEAPATEGNSDPVQNMDTDLDESAADEDQPAEN